MIGEQVPSGGEGRDKNKKGNHNKSAETVNSVNGGIIENGPLAMESLVESRWRPPPPPSPHPPAATRMLTFGMDRLLSSSKSSSKDEPEEDLEDEEEENEGDDDDGEGGYSSEIQRFLNRLSNRRI